MDNSEISARNRLFLTPTSYNTGNTKNSSIQPLQLGFFVAISLIFLLLSFLIWTYPEVVTAPHGSSTGGTSIALLTFLTSLYGIIGFTLLRLSTRTVDQTAALWRAMWLGIIIGGGVVVAICSDLLFGSPSLISMSIWLVVTVAAIGGWGVTSVRRTHASRLWQYGLITTLWSGIVSALVAVIGEELSLVLSLPRLMLDQLNNPDYIVWHQLDLRSYTIASVLAVSSLGLILVLIATTVISVLGSLFSVIWYQRATDISNTVQ